MSPRRVAEGAEDLCGIAVGIDPVFRMPLHADREGAGILHRNRLDRAVLGDRLDLKSRAQPVDALAMHRIDHDVACAEHAGEAASRLDRYILADGEALVLVVAHRRAVVERAFALLDLGGERAAERHVQLLDAAADGEQRHAVLDRLADQRQRGRVAVGIVGAVGLAGVAAIERGMHVRLRAGDHDAVDRGEQLVEIEPVAEGRHQQRKHAGAGDRGLEILLRRGVPGVVVELA